MTRSFALPLAFVAAALLAPSLVHGQGIVTGVLLDSLRGGTPITGAAVLLGEAEEPAALTDHLGRFRITGVPTGTARVRLRHPRLDSLGLDPLEQTATLRSPQDSVHIVFLTPSLSDALRLLCGGPAAQHTGVIGTVTDVFGRVVAGADVEVTWEEQIIGPGERTQRADTARASTDERGLFTLCRAPASRALIVDASGRTRIHSALRLTARSGSMRSRAIDLDDVGSIAMSVRVRIAPETQRTTSFGTVLDSLGGPLAGARVSVDGESSNAVVTDPQGYFRLQRVPSSTHQLSVRAIGYEPLLMVVSADSSADIDVGTVQLAKLPTALDTIRVQSSLMSREQRGFIARRSVLAGTFLDEQEIAKLPRLTAGLIASRMDRAEIRGGGTAKRLAFRRVGMAGDEYCAPRIFLDGQDLRDDVGMDELDSYLAIAKRIEVYRATAAPPEFTDFSGCGALVIWTK